MGIAIHNLSASGVEGGHASSSSPVGLDLAAAIRQDAPGLLGSSAVAADLVRGACLPSGDSNLAHYARFLSAYVPTFVHPLWRR